ncbi:PEPxxWA-CTERM sorting domain-containing protein [Sandarakinorhabdus sp.]|uniref:PEPxxWA-CTERM sorting domain-containing protein n=1 Tax=Sandarakinorhabdus sp. TaxID=1916663 RepID=UPI00286D9B86|nr:PEPxxWA-CTERM sorting domain-containing protein [Sandarakinorhabdus sp.]
MRTFLLMIAAAAIAVPTHAAVTLTFDDIPDRAKPHDFYDGGLAVFGGGMSGDSGPGFGVQIRGDAFVLEKIRECPEAAWCGSSAIPTPPSGLKALGASISGDVFRQVTINIAAGFTGEMSFWSYVGGGALADPGGVKIFENLGGNQASVNPLLAFVALPAPTTCVFTFRVVTEVTGCSFVKHTLAFSGTARSVVLGGAFFDNITFGAAAAGPPTGAVPEPAAWAMLITGLGLTGTALRRRRRQPAGVPA